MIKIDDRLTWLELRGLGFTHISSTIADDTFFNHESWISCKLIGGRYLVTKVIPYNRTGTETLF